MEAYYFSFQSMTQAQTATMILRQHGLAVHFMRAPKAISISGCGYAVKTGVSDGSGAADILRNAGVLPQKIFKIVNNGFLQEVSL